MNTNPSPYLSLYFSKISLLNGKSVEDVHPPTMAAPFSSTAIDRPDSPLTPPTNVEYRIVFSGLIFITKQSEARCPVLT
ncbi:MAG: fimbrial biogenesis chaperone [Candidatus Thorarchaeota archaeon]